MSNLTGGCHSSACWDFLCEKGKRLHSLQEPDTSEIVRLYPCSAHTPHLTACTQHVIFTCKLLESALPRPALLVGGNCSSQPPVLASTAHTPTTQELVLHLYSCFCHSWGSCWTPLAYSSLKNKRDLETEKNPFVTCLKPCWFFS